jgi:hypothetical protein
MIDEQRLAPDPAREADDRFFTNQSLRTTAELAKIRGLLVQLATIGWLWSAGAVALFLFWLYRATR